MKNKNEKITEFNILGVNIQFIITILVVIFGVVVLLTNRFLFVLEILMSIDLFIMAYNNHKIYHRKITYLYILIAVILFIVSILSLLGVF